VRQRRGVRVRRRRFERVGWVEDQGGVGWDGSRGRCVSDRNDDGGIWILYATL